MSELHTRYSEKFIRELRSYYVFLRNRPGTRFDVERRVEYSLKAVKWRTSFPRFFVEREMRIEGGNVLDMGCGSGPASVSFALAGGKIYAVDIDRYGLKIGKLRANEHSVEVNFVYSDGRSLCFPDKVFDISIALELLEHIPSTYQDKILREIFRVTKKGGIIVITTPNKLFPIDLHGSQLPLVHLLPRRLGAALTRIFRRGLPAGGYLVTYDEVLNILRRQGEYTLLNKFDIFYDIHDFEKNKDKYVRAHTKENKVYLLFSPFIFRLFRLLRIQYNRYAPHLAFIIRKKGP